MQRAPPRQARGPLSFVSGSAGRGERDEHKRNQNGDVITEINVGQWFFNVTRMKGTGKQVKYDFNKIRLKFM